MEKLNVLQVFLAQAAPEVAKQAAAPATPPPDFSFWGSILSAGWVEQLVMLVLVGFSIVSWAIISYKFRMLRKAYQESEEFLDTFWASKRLDDIYQKSEEYKASPVSQVYRAGFVELAKLKQKEKSSASDDIQMGAIESVERSMRRAASKELTNLESLVAFLGTTGATTPFIGLLGTVIGIMSAFQKIGIDKSAGLETVAPGIGGALVATAFGLFAAIPAVIAYNYFLTSITVLDAEMDHFSADFLNIIKRHFF